MPNQPIDDELATFLAASIPSIWTVECLLLLKRLTPATKTRADIVTALRSSELAIAQGLDRLERAGLVSQTDGNYCYSPATRLLDELTGRVEQLYIHRPISLMNIIVRAKHGNLQVFADSFRLKE